MYYVYLYAFLITGNNLSVVVTILQIYDRSTNITTDLETALGKDLRKQVGVFYLSINML